jgi:drug/metabolite transporter (DMT)-like permease
MKQNSSELWVFFFIAPAWRSTIGEWKTMADEITWGIVFGLIAACTLNLGKALQKQGIKLFERQKMEGGARAKKGAIWLVGISLSTIQPIFQIIGQTILGAPATVYSAMLGVGIVVVIFYAHKVLKEPIGKIEVLGAVTIIGGTLLFGIASVFWQRPASRTMDWTNFSVSLIVIGAAFVSIIIYTVKTKNLWGLIWGIVAGSLGGMDNIFKSMSKDVGTTLDLGAFSGFANVFFYISFVSGMGAMLLTNVGYTRGKAVTVVPAYTAFYILVPLVLEAFFYGIMPAVLQVIGVAIAVTGVVLSTAFRKEKVVEAGKSVEPARDETPKL